MADVNTIKVVSYENLKSYDKLIKTYIDTADAAIDAKSVKTILWDDTAEQIKFYKKENATLADTADYTVSVASSDVATLKEQMAEVQGTLTGYSSTSTVAAGVAAAEKNAKDYADAEIKKLADGAVADNTKAIADEAKRADEAEKANAKAIADEKTRAEAAESDLDTAVKAAQKTADDITTLVGTIPTTSEAETVTAYVDEQVAKATGDAKKVADDLASYKTTNDAAVKAAQDAADAAQDDVDALEGVVGDMSAVKTTAKTVAGAVDELYDALEDAQEAGEVSMVEAVGTDNILKTYTFYQGEQTEANKIGVVNIPKDLVVTSGEVVKNPEGQPAGTYIKLTIANQEAPIFINVLDLVNDFTVEADADEIQLAISETREISATIVDGAVDTDKLAASAVTTAKVADKNITKAKLSDDVQATLDKADAAEQNIKDAIEALDYTTAPGEGDDYVASITETDGVIAPVYGTFNFDEKGSAAQALIDAKQYADDLYEIATATDITDLFKDEVTE